MTVGKCPSCGDPLAHLVLEPIELRRGAHHHQGALYQCPACRAVLSVGVDPIQLAKSPVKEVLKMWGRPGPAGNPPTVS